MSLIVAEDLAAYRKPEFPLLDASALQLVPRAVQPRGIVQQMNSQVLRRHGASRLEVSHLEIFFEALYSQIPEHRGTAAEACPLQRSGTLEPAIFQPTEYPTALSVCSTCTWSM